VPPCRIDPVDLHQMLMNLVLNARDALGEHGRIEISLERRHVLPSSCAICEQTIAGDHIALSVADNGPGIPPELLGQVFDPFFTTKEQGKGTGLGLSVVQGILRQAGGHVLLASSPRQGTCFRLLLPRKEENAAETADAVRCHVLLVDDEEGLRLYLEEVLRDLGCQVTAHGEGAAALSDFCARPDSFTLLLSDQAMPGLQGLELARAVRALRPRLPIVLMSGNPLAIEPEELRCLDIPPLLVKPIAEDQLREALRRAREAEAGTAPVPADDTP